MLVELHHSLLSAILILNQEVYSGKRIINQVVGYSTHRITNLVESSANRWAKILWVPEALQGSLLKDLEVV